jgi:hypothetical protein
VTELHELIERGVPAELAAGRLSLQGVFGEVGRRSSSTRPAGVTLGSCERRPTRPPAEVAAERAVATVERNP